MFISTIELVITVWSLKCLDTLVNILMYVYIIEIVGYIMLLSLDL